MIKSVFSCAFLHNLSRLQRYMLWAGVMFPVLGVIFFYSFSLQVPVTVELSESFSANRASAFSVYYVSKKGEARLFDFVNGYYRSKRLSSDDAGRVFTVSVPRSYGRVVLSDCNENSVFRLREIRIGNQSSSGKELFDEVSVMNGTKTLSQTSPTDVEIRFTDGCGYFSLAIPPAAKVFPFGKAIFFALLASVVIALLLDMFCSLPVRLWMREHVRALMHAALFFFVINLMIIVILPFVCQQQVTVRFTQDFPADKSLNRIGGGRFFPFSNRNGLFPFERINDREFKTRIPLCVNRLALKTEGGAGVAPPIESVQIGDRSFAQEELSILLRQRKSSFRGRDFFFVLSSDFSEERAILTRILFVCLLGVNILYISGVFLIFRLMRGNFTVKSPKCGKRFLGALSTLAFLFYCLISFSYYNLIMAVGYIIGSDSSVNAMTAASIAQGFGFQYEGTLFSPYITTGPSILYPLAAAMYAMERNPYFYNIFLFAYCALLLVLSIVCVWCRLRSALWLKFLWAGFFIAVIWASSTGTFPVCFAVLGETIAGFFLIFGGIILFFYSDRFLPLFVGGCLLALATLSKDLAFLYGMLMVAGYFWVRMQLTGDLLKTIRDTAYIALGFGFPCLLYAIYQYSILGAEAYAFLKVDETIRRGSNMGLGFGKYSLDYFTGNLTANWRALADQSIWLYFFLAGGAWGVVKLLGKPQRRADKLYYYPAVLWVVAMGGVIWSMLFVPSQSNMLRYIQIAWFTGAVGWSFALLQIKYRDYFVAGLIFCSMYPAEKLKTFSQDIYQHASGFLNRKQTEADNRIILTHYHVSENWPARQVFSYGNLWRFFFQLKVATPMMRNMAEIDKTLQENTEPLLVVCAAEEEEKFAKYSPEILWREGYVTWMRISPPSPGQ